MVRLGVCPGSMIRLAVSFCSKISHFVVLRCALATFALHCLQRLSWRISFSFFVLLIGNAQIGFLQPQSTQTLCESSKTHSDHLSCQIPNWHHCSWPTLYCFHDESPFHPALRANTAPTIFGAVPDISSLKLSR